MTTVYRKYIDEFQGMSQAQALERACDAAGAGHISIVRAYIKVFGAGHIDDPEGFLHRTLFARAIHASQLKVAQYLLDCGANIDAKDSYGRTSLYLLTCYDNDGDSYKNAMAFLVSRGASRDLRDAKGVDLMSKLKERNRAYLQELFDRYDGILKPTDAEVAKYLRDAREGHAQQLREFIDRFGKGAVDVEDILGNSALFMALQAGRKNVCEVLLKAGADINKVDKFDGGILKYIVQNMKNEYLDYAIEKGADLDQADQHGKTPVMHATDAFNTAAVKKLVTAGAEWKKENKYGQNALHYAQAKKGLAADIAEYFEGLRQKEIEAAAHGGIKNGVMPAKKIVFKSIKSGSAKRRRYI